MADIAITDDALGSNTLSLNGAGKDPFEIDGKALYLKAGAVLDFETKPRYAVTVQVHERGPIACAQFLQDDSHTQGHCRTHEQACYAHRAPPHQPLAPP